MKQKTLRKHYSSLNEESSRKTMNKWELYAELRNRLNFCSTGIPLKCPNSECMESTGTQYKRIVRQYCGIRICNKKGCVSKRQAVIRRKYDAKLNNFNDSRFLTLTLKGYHPLTREPLKRLNYAWKRLSILLRKNGYLKSYIKVIEMVGKEWVDKDLEYHEAYFWHVHACYDGTYIAADVLRAAWKRFTGDSNWVRIERVKRNFSAAAYLRKYLNKMAYDDIDIDTYFQICKMKLISSYGCVAELETLLEEYVLIQKTKCPICNSRLIPERREDKPPDIQKPLNSITSYI